MYDVPKKPNEDEIDLFDLLIVLIKYRRLIILTMVIGIILSVAGYFIYPSWKFKKLPSNRTYKTICRVMAGPIISEEEGRIELITLFMSTPVILQAMEEAGAEDIRGYSLNNVESRQKALESLETNSPLEIIDETNDIGRRNYAVNPTSQVIKISYINNSPNQAEIFLSILYERVLSKIRFIKNSNSKESILPLILYDEPYTVLEPSNYTLVQIKQSYMIKALIICISLFFLIIFLSFILEFIYNLKRDTKKMEKIKKILNKE